MYQQSVTAASFPRYSPSFPRRRETTGWQGDAGEQDNTNQYPSPLMTEDQSLSQCLTLGAEGEINTPTHVTDCTRPCRTTPHTQPHPQPITPSHTYPSMSISGETPLNFKAIRRPSLSNGYIIQAVPGDVNKMRLATLNNPRRPDIKASI